MHLSIVHLTNLTNLMFVYIVMISIILFTVDFVFVCVVFIYIREVKISRQRVRERNFCVLTSSFLVSFLCFYSSSL